MENSVSISNKVKKIVWNEVPSDRINSVVVKFTFSSEWNDLICVAQFIQNEQCYDQLIVDNKCTIPAEIKEGYCILSVFGTKKDGSAYRSTTIPLSFPVVESSYCTDGVPPLPPTPDLYDQLIKEFSKGLPDAQAVEQLAEDAKRIAQSVRDDADAGKFNGEKGEKGDRGDSGVYVGADPVPEGTKVQVNPNGETILIPEKTSELENDSDFATNKSVDDKIANIPSGDSGISRLVVLPQNQEFRHDSFNISANNTLVLLFSISPYDNVTHNSKFTGFPKIKSIGDGFYAFDKNLITKVMLYSLGNGHTADFSELITDFDDSAVVCNEIYVAGDSPELLGLVKIKCETAELANSLKETIANVIDSGSFSVAFIFQEIQDTIISEEIV